MLLLMWKNKYVMCMQYGEIRSCASCGSICMMCGGRMTLQMANCYVVSAKRATAVSHALTGNLTGPEDLNLILAKTNRLEIFIVTSEGLKAIQEVPIFGRIATLNIFRSKNDTCDSLVLLTCKYHLAVLGWDREKKEIFTRASGMVAERVGRPSESGMITCVHPNGLIALRLYDGNLKMVEWDDGKDLRSYNVRVEDMGIVDLQFLSPTAAHDRPRMCYIYHDAKGRHLKTIEINQLEKDIKLLSHQDNIESEATMIIPVPYPIGGCIILGQETILYNRDDNTYLSVSPPYLEHAQFMCYAKIDKDGQRFLLGDMNGHIYVVILDIDTNNGPAMATDLKVELLGETSIPECLVYLDNGVVFVGSRFGDSQLIRLNSEPHPETNNFITVLETYNNLAPIRDMVLIETDGLKHVITCSGAFKDGSLRIIRNGIGIEESASVDLPGVKGLFPLRLNSQFDNYLVVSLSDETHILHIMGEELEDTPLFGMETDEATLWTGVTPDGYVLQVTPSSVRLAKEDTQVIWRQPEGMPTMCLVAVNADQGQILAAAGAHMFYLEIANGQLNLVKTVKMNEEVACLDITPLDDGEKATLAVVGLWTEMSAVLLTLPDLAEVHRERLKTEILPRSILLTRMEHVVYLLVAMGDGALIYYTVDQESGVFCEPKKATLGTQPTILRRFRSRGKWSVFACSDRPAVLFSSAGKLLFSNVNLKQVTQMCTLHSEAYNDSLVLSDGEGLSIGRIDDIQKLHIRTVPMGEHVLRIAHQPATGTIAIITQREENAMRMSVSKLASTTSTSRTSNPGPSRDMNVPEGEIHSVVILDHNTFEILHSHELRQHEHALAIHSTTLGDDPAPYYVVGTAIVHPEDSEAKLGRILIFEAGSGEQRTSLRLIHEKEIKGAAYSIATLGGKIVVTVNSSTRLFEWTPDKELRLECSHFNYITAVCVKTKGDMLLVGDLMRSLCLLSYKNVESSFEEVARDFSSQWVTSCDILDGDSFVSGEASYNLFTVERDADAVHLEGRQRLQESGAFYLGELVNVFQRGSLVSNRTDSIIPFKNTLIFGTADGCIGMLGQLEAEFFNFLLEVESAIAAKTTNCVRVEHSHYRSFQSDKLIRPKRGFVDGDLVESLLDMPREHALSIVSNICLPGTTDRNPEEVLKYVEELSRLH